MTIEKLALPAPTSGTATAADEPCPALTERVRLKFPPEKFIVGPVPLHPSPFQLGEVLKFPLYKPTEAIPACGNIRDLTTIFVALVLMGDVRLCVQPLMTVSISPVPVPWSIMLPQLGPPPIVAYEPDHPAVSAGVLLL